MGTPSDPIKQEKAAFRRSWLKSYPEYLKDREQLSKEVCNFLVEQNFFRTATKIALFAGREHEVNLLPLFHLLSRAYFFPQVNSEERKMVFIEVSDPQSLVASRWGILEPPPSTLVSAPWTERDLVLVPGFAFDVRGNRIGSGGGYYDRFFAKNPLPKRWGICFEPQFHQRELAHTHHDVRMEAVITNQGLRFPKKGK